MPHPHEVAKLYTDEETKSTIGQHQLPIPMGWKILIQPNQIKQQTKGGILLPTKAKENEAYLTAHGEVVGIGELAYRERGTGDSWKISNKPRVGNKVTYGKYAGQKLVVNGVRFLLLNDDEITSILPDGVEVTAYL
jgi:co-chaperonin GroES (HSP10)|tara:strand:+ start:767 stop:1174 length:408 start_codon:yes stop_codon:yes gene_type:complete